MIKRYLPACVFIFFWYFVQFNWSVNRLIDWFTSLFADIVSIARLTMKEAGVYAKEIFNGV